MCDKFKRLFHLESQKRVLVGERGEWNGNEWRWVWGWERELRGRAVTEFDEMLNLVNNVKLIQSKKDRRRWFLEESGDFKVKMLREMVDEKVLEGDGAARETQWIKYLPRKVNVFMWLLQLGRFPTKSNIRSYGFRFFVLVA